MKKKKQPMVMLMQNLKDISQPSISSTLEEDTSYTNFFDEIDYEQPPNPKEMERLYGRDYELMKQLEYNGKGCGKKE